VKHVDRQVAAGARAKVRVIASDKLAEDALRRDRLLLSIGLHGGPPVALLALTALAIAAAEVAFPAVLGRGIDAAIGDRAARGWVTWTVLLIAAMVAADALDDLATGNVVARSTAWTRARLLAHILALGNRATERFTPGDLVGRLVGNAAQTGRAAPVAIRAVANLIPGIGGPVGLALIDPWLCVTFLAGLPVLVLLARALRRDVQDVAEHYLSVQGEIASRLVDALAGVRTIAAAGKLDLEAERVLEPLPELHHHGLGIWRAQMRIASQNGLLVSLLEVGVLAVAGLELANGRITPGKMLAAGQYALLGATMSSVLGAVTALARARAAAGRIAEVLATPPIASGSRSLPPGGGRLDFRGVTVRRDGRTLLHAIDLTVPEGAVVAIVGRSGAGKSLLAGLVGRLLDPDAGEVLLDGVPVSDLDPQELRGAVGYGFERPALIGETVADAIAFGRDQPPLYSVVEAAITAHADDFIRHLPGRYRTPLSQAPMSGGEVQRVGLARTFAHAGRVLVLDDVAASLDTVTERQITQVLLAGALADRTRIIVAHRASSAAAADVVVWLEHGRVRAAAPHVQLWLQPDYRALFGTREAPAENGRHNGNGRAAWTR
jgi:ATP-binding cassette subfamily B protein